MKKVILFLFFCVSLYGFSGRVVDYNEKPIEGVLVKSKNQYCFTDEKGIYFFKQISKNDTLLFHKLGYCDKRISVKKTGKIVKLSLLPVNLRGIKIIESYKKTVPDAKVIKKIKSGKELSQILSDDAEIYVKGSNISGGEKSISIGGNLSKHTVVMLDGIVLNDAGKEFDISQIPVEIVDRVEIIKSNASAVAGSGGIGGIVNIITKNGATNKFKLKSNLGIGSFGKYNISQQLDFSKGIAVNLFIKREKAKNNFLYTYTSSNDKPDSTRRNNESKIWDLNLNATYKNLKFTILYKNIYKGLPGTTDKLPMFDKAHLKADKIKSIASYFFKIKSVGLNTKIYFLKDNTRYTNTKSTIPVYYSKTKTNDTKWGIKTNQTVEFLKTKITFFQSYKREIFKFTDLFAHQNSIPKIFRDNISISNAIEKNFNILGFKLHLHSFARIDETKLSDKKKSEKFLSYRITAEIVKNYLLRVPQSLLAVYANSYSLPSFYDIYWKGDIQTQGNKELKSEFSKGYEIIYKVGYETQNITLSYNKNKIKDLIYWYKSVVAWKPGNIANAEISNITVSFEQNYKILGLKISFTKTKALDKTTLQNGEHSNYYNKKLIYVPEYKLNFETTFDFEFFNLKIVYSEIGKRWVTRDNLWGFLPDYNILSGELEIMKNLSDKYFSTINLSVNNIFDNKFDKYQLMPSPGINFSLNFTVQKK